MRSPQDMRIIQIDITNACVHKCSNCTRFCGHHPKPFFMDWETFQRAVKSLKGFKNTIGIMGGEPTLHPQFKRFANFVSEHHSSKYNLPTSKEPINNFVQYVRNKNFLLDETLNERQGPGLWTSVCNNYYEHYETIQDIFSYQCINDHQNPSLHQPLLISRKEFGISDEEWFTLRDQCWIQNMWSASITPKGAFFCEVAGALDMLFDGPGGWPIEEGWWKRKPEDFGDQLHWCEMCGGALLNSGRLSSEEIDDISPILYEKLKKQQSPKVKQGQVNILSPLQKIDGDEMPDTRNRYLTNYQERISKGNTALHPRTIEGIVFCNTEEQVEQLQQSFHTPNAFSGLDQIIMVPRNDTIYSLLHARYGTNSKVVLLSATNLEWGRMLNCAVQKGKRDWYFIMEFTEAESADFYSGLKTRILNPGILYRSPNGGLLFNVRALALRDAGYDGIGQCYSQKDFQNLWQPEKQLTLIQNYQEIQNPDLREWETYCDALAATEKEKAQDCLEKIKTGE